MKKSILNVSIFFMVQALFSQTGIVDYRVESLKRSNLDRPNVIAINKEIPLMRFKLSYNKDNSCFKKEKNIPVNKLHSKLAEIVVLYPDIWFQERLTKEVVFNKEVKHIMYQVVHNKMNGWELFDETKKIQGYTCYKAVRKELIEKTNTYTVIEAWYVPEIPVPYGPVGNGGLPGLILQLKRPNFLLYTATKVTLNPKKIKVIKPQKGRKINLKELKIIMRKARKVTLD